MPVPEDRPFAGGSVHDDDTDLIGRAADDAGVTGVYAFAGQTSKLHPPSFVIADFADVAGPESEAPAGDERGRDLPACQQARREDAFLAPERWIVRDLEEHVRGVQSHADDVHSRLSQRAYSVQHGIPWRSFAPSAFAPGIFE